MGVFDVGLDVFIALFKALVIYNLLVCGLDDVGGIDIIAVSIKIYCTLNSSLYNYKGKK